MLASSELLDPNLSRNMSGKVPEWSERSSKWPELKRHALSFLIKLTRSVELDLMMDQEEIIKCKGPCSKLSIRWMASNLEAILKC